MLYWRSMKKLFSYGPLLIVIAAVLWGLDGVLRRSLYALPPVIIVFYEHLIGLLLLLPALVSSVKKESLSHREWLAVLWVSLLSGLLGTLWFTTALLKVQFIPFSVVFLLQKLQPLFATLAGVILLKEKITKDHALWAGFALVSAYFVTFPGGQVNFATGSGTVVAALFAVGAAFAWGSSTAVSRLALKNHSDTLITGLRFFLTTLMALVGVYLLGQSDALLLPTLPQLSRLVVIALSTGMLALWIYYKGLKKTEVKVATILELVFPLTAVIIDLVFYQTTLATSQYLAAGALLFSIWQMSKLNQVKA